MGHIQNGSEWIWMVEIYWGEYGFGYVFSFLSESSHGLFDLWKLKDLASVVSCLFGRRQQLRMWIGDLSKTNFLRHLQELVTGISRTWSWKQKAECRSCLDPGYFGWFSSCSDPKTFLLCFHFFISPVEMIKKMRSIWYPIEVFYMAWLPGSTTISAAGSAPGVENRPFLYRKNRREGSWFRVYTPAMFKKLFCF